MEKRAIMQFANPVLPGGGFARESLLAPRQALVAFFSHASIGPVGTEMVALEETRGRVLAQAVVADGDYPNAARSVMDGFALRAQSAPGNFAIVADIAMGAAPTLELRDASAMRIPTGGVLPLGADAVVPIEEARVEGDVVCVDHAVAAGENVAPAGADMRAGETILPAGRRIRSGEIGLLATLGMTRARVYRQPLFGVLSSGDEIVEPDCEPQPGQIRDSNRYAIAASLRAMGALVQHYPTLRDEAGEVEAGLARALAECDGVVLTGGSSVGERDRIPAAVAAVATPGAIVHGLRVKPGKPTLFGAHGSKPIVGLPGNPTSALFMLEAVAAPIVGALVGATVEPGTVPARLDAPAQSRLGWTWFFPVSLRHEGGSPLAHPLAMRSFSVSLAARADGYLIMEEGDETWPAGTAVMVHRFLGG